jgi:hypothetical protein
MIRNQGEQYEQRRRPCTLIRNCLTGLEVEEVILAVEVELFSIYGRGDMVKFVRWVTHEFAHCEGTAPFFWTGTIETFGGHSRKTAGIVLCNINATG